MKKCSIEDVDVYYKETKARLDKYETITNKFVNIPETSCHDITMIATSIEFNLIQFIKSKSHWGKNELKEFLPRVIQSAFEDRAMIIDCYHKTMKGLTK